MVAVDTNSFVARSALGGTWNETWMSLLNNKSAFYSPHSMPGLHNWPNGCPLGKISDWTPIPEPQFENRTEQLLKLLAIDTWPYLKKKYLDGKKLKLSIIIATSHGDPGPISVLAENDIHSLNRNCINKICKENLQETLSEVFDYDYFTSTLSAACASSLVGAIIGAKRILHSTSDIVIIFALDTLSRVAYTGFNLVGAMSKEGTKPFDENRDGMTASEGGAAFILCKDDLINTTEKIILVGGDFNCDKSHMVEPSKKGLQECINNTLFNYNIKPENIAFIYWHGTGTQLNDNTEAEVACELFNNNSAPPGCSIKGGLGHTMGASGAFNILSACRTLETGILPATIRLNNTSFTHLNVQASSRVTEKGYGLCVSMGFGGINSSIILGKYN